MSIIYFLIPLSLLLVLLAVAGFFWAVRSGQFEDLHTPALKILDNKKELVAKADTKTDTGTEKDQ